MTAGILPNLNSSSTTATLLPTQQPHSQRTTKTHSTLTFLEASTHGICCFTYGSKTEHGTGGRFVIYDTRSETITEHSFKMKNYCNVFQAEMAAIKHAAEELTFNNQQITFLERQPICTTGSLQ